MSIFKKPIEREPKQTFSMLIYGMPGCGKSTLACSAPGAVMIDFENGMHRVELRHQVPSFCPADWNEVMSAIDEIAESEEIKSVIVDSVDRLMEYALEHVLRTYDKARQSDGMPTQKAYGKRKDLYKNFVQRLRNSGKNIIYVAHVVEDKQIINGDEVVTLRPNISKSNAPDITTDLDMEGMVIHNDNTFAITFDAYCNSEHKNSFGFHGVFNEKTNTFAPISVDDLTDASKSNNYLSRMFAKKIANDIAARSQYTK